MKKKMSENTFQRIITKRGALYVPNEVVEQIRAKAIDDFVKFANTMPTVEEEDGTIRPMWLEEIAEQLKAGVKNE